MSNEKGFSLIQSMIAVGIAGMIGAGTMNLMHQQSKILKTAERSSTINQIHNQVFTVLSTGTVCTQILQNRLGSGVFLEGASSSLNDGEQLNYVVQGGSVPVTLVEVGETYDGVRVTGVDIQRTGTAQVTFFLEFEKERDRTASGEAIKRGTYGSRVRVKPVVLAANFSGDVFQSCHGVDTAISENVQEEFCVNSLGGTWDPTQTPPCSNLQNVDEEICINIIGGNWDASTNECLGAELGLYCNATGTVCINPELSCGSGEVLVGYSSSTGQPTCINIGDAIADAISCGAGEVLTVAGGSLQCVAATTGGTTSGGGTATTTTTTLGLTQYVCTTSGWSSMGASCSTETPGCFTASPVLNGANFCCSSSPNPSKCSGMSAVTTTTTTGMLTGKRWKCNAPGSSSTGSFIQVGSCTTSSYASCTGGGSSMITATHGDGICCHPSVTNVTGIGCTGGGSSSGGAAVGGGTCSGYIATQWCRAGGQNGCFGYSGSDGNGPFLLGAGCCGGSPPSVPVYGSCNSP